MEPAQLQISKQCCKSPIPNLHVLQAVPVDACEERVALDFLDPIGTEPFILITPARKRMFTAKQSYAGLLT